MLFTFEFNAVVVIITAADDDCDSFGSLAKVEENIGLAANTHTHTHSVDKVTSSAHIY